MKSSSTIHEMCKKQQLEYDRKKDTKGNSRDREDPMYTIV